MQYSLKIWNGASLRVNVLYILKGILEHIYFDFMATTFTKSAASSILSVTPINKVIAINPDFALAKSA